MSNEPDIQAYLDAAAKAAAGLAHHAETVQAIGGRIVRIFREGGRVLTCGNGGSAAEALHLAEELIGRYRKNRPPLAALCLNADPTVLTCIANDWDYSEVFARQVEGLGRPGDALVALTTSGKSANVLRALQRARGQSMVTIGLLGQTGSPAEAFCDFAFVPGGQAASHIQEAHLIVIHAILEIVDAAMGDGGKVNPAS